jgi:hypothetical protein
MHSSTRSGCSPGMSPTASAANYVSARELHARWMLIGSRPEPQKQKHSSVTINNEEPADADTLRMAVTQTDKPGTMVGVLCYGVQRFTRTPCGPQKDPLRGAPTVTHTINRPDQCSWRCVDLGRGRNFQGRRVRPCESGTLPVSIMMPSISGQIQPTVPKVRTVIAIWRTPMVV